MNFDVMFNNNIINKYKTDLQGNYSIINKIKNGLKLREINLSNKPRPLAKSLLS